jgi:hypothetical protein
MASRFANAAKGTGDVGAVHLADLLSRLAIVIRNPDL